MRVSAAHFLNTLRGSTPEEVRVMGLFFPALRVHWDAAQGKTVYLFEDTGLALDDVIELLKLSDNVNFAPVSAVGHGSKLARARDVLEQWLVSHGYCEAHTGNNAPRWTRRWTARAFAERYDLIRGEA
jgi:hypothetical protein